MYRNNIKIIRLHIYMFKYTIYLYSIIAIEINIFIINHEHEVIWIFCKHL